MTNAFLSAPIHVMLERINTCPELLELFRGEQLRERLRRLKTALLTVDAVLNDAEQKEDRSRDVKSWLNELKDAFYQVEDALDDIYTETRRRKLEGEDGVFAGMMQIGRKIIMPGSDSLNKKVGKLLSVIEALDRLVKKTDELGLREDTEIRILSLSQRSRSDRSPHLVESRMIGREGDKKAILDLLLSEDVISSSNLSVIPIVGMPGVGKTTLAQAVFNDKRINEHFDLKGWVSVGESFHVLRVMEAALQEFTSGSCTVEDLHSLQVEVKMNLEGKKFLLVLDDVWCEKPSEWEALRVPLSAGAKGSKVVITTRSTATTSIVQTAKSYHLKLLSEEDCWELFVKLAFGNKLLGSSYQELEAIGRKIVKKCNGLPLATKAVASYLCSKPSVDEWLSVLRNFQHYTAEALQVLKLSYHSLPSHLKQCFAYCSIFPKGHEFERQNLVQLWMAVDLLQKSRSKKRLEDIGEEYFNYLLSRSFFQQSARSKSHYVMHDLMNDLAKSVSGEFCLRLEANATSQIPDKVRHLSFCGKECDAASIFVTISGAKFLRTILPFELPQGLECLQLNDQVLQEVLPLPCLRVLCLSHYRITRLPESIGALKLLRYLDLSSTAIRRLPESVCTLYNLHILLLSNCQLLTRLPTSIGKLINLRYFDLVGTSLKRMPIGISKLKKLQTLSNFVVARNSGAELRELKELLYLEGTLCISELQLVAFASEAKEASLGTKKYLDNLVLKWGGGAGGGAGAGADTYYAGKLPTIACDQREVLLMLQPHHNLKCLTIELYRGANFPIWLGDPAYSSMVCMCLKNCNFCQSLPPLGQLPSLKELIIEKLDGIVKVSDEFYRKNIHIVTPFQSLQTLKFYGMSMWEEWISPGMEGGAFPCLRELSLHGCPKLRTDLPKDLPSFTRVNISDCPHVPHVDDVLQRHVVTNPEEGSSEQPTVSSSVSTTSDSRLSEDLSRRSGSAGGASAAIRQSSVEDESESSDEEGPASEGFDMVPPELPSYNVSGKLQMHYNSRRDETASQYDQTVISEGSYGFDVSGRLTERSSFSKVIQEPQILLDEIPGPSSYADIPNYVGYSQDDQQDAESFKVSETSQLMELPRGVCSLQIEGCDGLECLPDRLMSSNPHLQDLFIINCSALESFPGGHPPIGLKTLYLRDCRKLEFIHSLQAMHQYAHLEYLFIGSSCDGLQSFPLAFFPELKSLSIWDCANFSSIDVPRGLDEGRISLEALEIKDCPCLVSFPKGGLPTPKLTSIVLSNCQNLKALPEQLYRLLFLESLFISECPELEAVPEDGFPSSLSTLSLSHCRKFIPKVEWGLRNLGKLHNFEIEGGGGEMVSFPDEALLPGNLYSLRISRFPELKELNYKGLQYLSSLHMLEINCCDKLESLPDEGLPPSLSYLCVNGCSLLQPKLLDKGMDWYKIAYLPRIEIDGETNTERLAEQFMEQSEKNKKHGKKDILKRK